MLCVRTKTTLLPPIPIWIGWQPTSQIGDSPQGRNTRGLGSRECLENVLRYNLRHVSRRRVKQIHCHVSRQKRGGGTRPHEFCKKFHHIKKKKWALGSPGRSTSPACKNLNCIIKNNFENSYLVIFFQLQRSTQCLQARPNKRPNKR